MSETRPFLLVHGALHGAWCWDQVVPALERRGRRAVAIDLPGAGDDAADAAEVTLNDYVERIIAAARDIGEPVVLVGHSMGGLSITAAAERAPELFSALVYVTAVLPVDQESLVTLMAGLGAPDAGWVPSAGGRLVGLPADQLSPKFFYHDCPPDLAANAMSRLRPIPLDVLVSPIQLAEGKAWKLPRHYVECTEDAAISIELQRSMIATHQPITVHTLPSAHSPFMSMPEELTDILASIS